MSYWVEVADGDPVLHAMYRRHYSCRNPRPRVRQFVGPGARMVLSGFMLPAMFVWRLGRYRMDLPAGINCSVFRNESPVLSSVLIREAMELAWERWPGTRLFTMVNPARIRSSNPGYCFLAAGWSRSGVTKKGLLILEALKES